MRETTMMTRRASFSLRIASLRIAGMAIACVVLSGTAIAAGAGAAEGYVISDDGPDGLNNSATTGAGARAPAPSAASRAAATKARSKWMETTTPVVGSPEWNREETENSKYEKNIDRMIKGICKGC